MIKNFDLYWADEFLNKDDVDQDFLVWHSSGSLNLDSLLIVNLTIVWEWGDLEQRSQFVFVKKFAREKSPTTIEKRSEVEREAEVVIGTAVEIGLEFVVGIGIEWIEWIEWIE